MRVSSLIIACVCTLALISTVFVNAQSMDDSMCNLNYLLISPSDPTAVLTPSFSASTTSYNVPVSKAPITTTVSAWQADAAAILTIQQNGGAVTSYLGGGNPSNLFTISSTTSVAITVSCESCSKTYTVNFVCAGTSTPVTPVTPVTPPSSGGLVVGDPQFTGLRGQSYQVHGVAGEVYNVITSATLQVNSKFVFLTSGVCPTLNGVLAKGCFSHPGSYLGEIGIKTANGDRLALVSGAAATGFASVTLNGRPITVGDSSVFGLNGHVNVNSTHVVTVNTGSSGNFAFVFENSDMYINQRVRVLNWNQIATSAPHGLLGQSWSPKRYGGIIKDIAGDVEDYLVTSRDLFGNDFTFNKFTSSQ